MIADCGHRYRQYVSVDPATGAREYSCGPASDLHTGGWEKDDKRPEHRYMKVIGGFLDAIVDRDAGKPFMQLQHRDVDGSLVNEDRIE